MIPDFLVTATIFIYVGILVILSCMIIEFSKYLIETLEWLNGNE